MEPDVVAAVAALFLAYAMVSGRRRHCAHGALLFVLLIPNEGEIPQGNTDPES
jgi:hypothetical protein